MVKTKSRPPRVYTDKDGKNYIMQAGKRLYIKAKKNLDKKKIIQIVLELLRKRRKKNKKRKDKKKGIFAMTGPRTGTYAGLPTSRIEVNMKDGSLIKKDDGLTDALRFSKIFADLANRFFQSRQLGIEDAPDSHKIDIIPKGQKSISLPLYDPATNKKVLKEVPVEMVQELIESQADEITFKDKNYLLEKEGREKAEGALDKIAQQEAEKRQKEQQEKIANNTEAFKKLISTKEIRKLGTKHSKSVKITGPSRDAVDYFFKKKPDLFSSSEMQRLLLLNAKDAQIQAEQLIKERLPLYVKGEEPKEQIKDAPDNKHKAPSSKVPAATIQTTASSSSSSSLSKYQNIAPNTLKKMLAERYKPSGRKMPQHPSNDVVIKLLEKLDQEEGETSFDEYLTPAKPKPRQTPATIRLMEPLAEYDPAHSDTEPAIYSPYMSHDELASPPPLDDAPPREYVEQPLTEEQLAQQKGIQDQIDALEKLEQDERNPDKADAIRKQIDDLVAKFSKIGSGTKGRGTYDYELERMMKKYKNFAGVYSINEINQIPAHDKLGVIINLSPNYQPGSHWCALYIDAKDSKSVEWYNSFGEDPPARVMKDIKKLIDRIDPSVYLKFKVNKVKQQRENSDTCGFFAAKFLIDRFHDKPFPECTGFSDVVKSEKQIKKFKKQQGFGFI